MQVSGRLVGEDQFRIEDDGRAPRRQVAAGRPRAGLEIDLFSDDVESSSVSHNRLTRSLCGSFCRKAALPSFQILSDCQSGASSEIRSYIGLMPVRCAS